MLHLDAFSESLSLRTDEVVGVPPFSRRNHYCNPPMWFDNTILPVLHRRGNGRPICRWLPFITTAEDSFGDASLSDSNLVNAECQSIGYAVQYDQRRRKYSVSRWFNNACERNDGADSFLPRMSAQQRIAIPGAQSGVERMCHNDSDGQ